MNPWLEKLTQLKNGELEEITVSLEDFPLFREGWKSLPDKMDYRGIASLGGNVTYVYDPSNTSN